MNKKYEMSTAQAIAAGFLATIVIGSLLLCLPIASAAGTWTSFIDAFFTATTSVCVTGLVVVDTYSHWSIFGQAVILLLIQCGGLGIITFSTFVMVLIGKKVSLKDRLLLEDAFNLNTLRGLVRFLERVLKGTITIEGIGALCYMLVFVPKYGVRGIWISVFNAVSAFCNAGMDVIGANSLMDYVNHPWINIVTMLLIILGGIGFIVWWDIVDVLRKVRSGDIARRLWYKLLKLHTKLIISATLILILGGAALVLLMEWGNPETLGPLSPGSKIMAAMFQSVTFRTAGFAMISQKGLCAGTVLVGVILMMIGGSPVGTAGGVKTSTISLLFLAAWSTIRGSEEVNVFHRTIPYKTIRKATAVFTVFVSALVIMILLMSMFEKGDFSDIAFETASALGTVGLSRDYTKQLDAIGKILIIICMYLGRIGPISMAIAFNFKGSRNKKFKIRYPEEDTTVG